MPELSDALAIADVVVASTGASDFGSMKSAWPMQWRCVRSARSYRGYRRSARRGSGRGASRQRRPGRRRWPQIGGERAARVAREAIPAVEKIVGEHVERFESWYRSRATLPVIAR